MKSDSFYCRRRLTFTFNSCNHFVLTWPFWIPSSSKQISWFLHYLPWSLYFILSKKLSVNWCNTFSEEGNSNLVEHSLFLQHMPLDAGNSVVYHTDHRSPWHLDWSPTHPHHKQPFLNFKVVINHAGLTNTSSFLSYRLCTTNSQYADQRTSVHHLSAFIKLRHTLGSFCLIALPCLIPVSWWCAFAKYSIKQHKIPYFLT